MRPRRCPGSRQHSFSFIRLDLWQSIPADDQRQCRDLWEQMLRVILKNEGDENSEVTDEREDPPHAP